MGVEVKLQAFLNSVHDEVKGSSPLYALAVKLDGLNLAGN
jgi:hypothetical protein